jgi:cell wall-associated NlpC family hydrolase
VPKGQEQPGDLVYFHYLPGHTGPGHVGIVYNPQKSIMIVAPHTGDVVKLQSYKNYPGGVVGFTRPTAHNGHNGPTKHL